MPSFFTSFVIFAALAGRALALNIVFGGANLSASQVIPTGKVPANCQATCDPVTKSIQTCGDTNDACLCSGTLISSLVSCEQCMFTTLINNNQKMSDPRVGSTPLLGAYRTVCLASQNVSIPATSVALTLPASWNGPFNVQIPNLAGTVVTVVVGAALGTSIILLLCNM